MRRALDLLVFLLALVGCGEVKAPEPLITSIDHVEAGGELVDGEAWLARWRERLDAKWRACRLAPAARVELDAHLEWLDGHNAGATARFVGALETLASGVADERPVTLPDRRRVRRWYVRPLLLYYVRQGSDVVMLRARHEARRPLGP